MSARAFIFDMDDLLIRTGDVWNRAAARLLQRHGRVWTAELEKHYKGMNCSDVADTLRKALELDVEAEAFREEYRAALIEAFPSRPQAMAGAVDLVRRLHGEGWPMAVASGSPMVVIERTMEQLGLRSCFRHLISSESVRRGKPHPDVFLAVAEALGVRSGECLVFEDSPAGVAAAKAAGMACFCVPSVDAARIKGATRLFRSLAEIGMEELDIGRDEGRGIRDGMPVG